MFENTAVKSTTLEGNRGQDSLLPTHWLSFSERVKTGPNPPPTQTSGAFLLFYFKSPKTGRGYLGLLSVIFWDRLPAWPVSSARELRS